MRIRRRQGTGYSHSGEGWYLHAVRRHANLAVQAFVVTALIIAVTASFSHSSAIPGYLVYALFTVACGLLTYAAWGYLRWTRWDNAERAFRATHTTASVRAARRAGITSHIHSQWASIYPDVSLWVLTSAYRDGITLTYGEAVASIRWSCQPTFRMVTEALHSGVSESTLREWSGVEVGSSFREVFTAMRAGVAPTDWPRWYRTFFLDTTRMMNSAPARVGAALIDAGVAPRLAISGATRHPYGVNEYAHLIERMETIFRFMDQSLPYRSTTRLAAEWALPVVTQSRLCQVPFRPVRDDIEPWHRAFGGDAPVLAGHYPSVDAAVDAIREDPTTVERLQQLRLLTLV